MAHLLLQLKKFFAATEGGIGPILGVLMIAIVSAVGVSVDTSRAYLVHDRLSRALDSAVLAAGSTKGNNAALEDRFNDVFNANYPEDALGDPYDVEFNPTDTTISASAKVDVKTTFMNVVGVDHITVSANTTVTKSIGNNIELSLIVDLSGSMAGQKISDLRSAAKSLVDIVVFDDQSKYYSKVALIPYNMAVNVGNYADAVRGSITSTGTCTTPGCKKFKFTSATGSTDTFTASNCVSERTGTNAYTDASPGTAFVGWNYPASGNPCLSNQIVPLTNNKTTLETDIAALQASGSTAGQIGIAWGWYMLSPDWASLWPSAAQPAAYNTKDLYKIAVIMTDGEYNSPYCKGVISKDATTGSGNTSDHINCNAPNGDAYSQSKKLCDGMKAKGIEIYTVGFEIDAYPAGKAVMQYCATDAGHFYNAANGSELQEAFESIAHNVSNIYLSQ